MSGNEIDNPEIAKWDPVFTELLINAVTPVVKRWFRPEVRAWRPSRQPVARCWCPTIPAAC